MSVKLTNQGIKFPDGSQTERATVYQGEVCFYNTCLVNNGPHQNGSHCGASGTWTVPADTSVITFHAWGGGGGGAGQCCNNCFCGTFSCAAHGGYYSRKTIRKCDGQFQDGCTYNWCYGDGGDGNTNNAGGFCFTVCCDGSRGCASYVNGPGLSNFCAVGGRGGRNSYYAYDYWNGEFSYECMQAIGMVPGTNIDFGHLGSETFWFSERIHCDCGPRLATTAKSYGLENAHAFMIPTSCSWCGCTNCRPGFHQIAQGGSNQMKSWCGNYICNCNGTPGKPGMIKIEWS